MGSQVTNAVLDQKLEMVCKQMSEIVSSMNDLSKDVQTMKTAETSCQAVVNIRMANMDADVKAMKERMNAFEKIIGEISTVNSVLKWLGGIVCALVVTLIWGIATHQILLTFVTK